SLCLCGSFVLARADEFADGHGAVAFMAQGGQETREGGGAGGAAAVHQDDAAGVDAGEDAALDLVRRDALADRVEAVGRPVDAAIAVPGGVAQDAAAAGAEGRAEVGVRAAPG